MSEKINSLLDAEQAMTQAIEKIISTLGKLDDFKSASGTLSEVYAKNQELLKGLREVTESLQAGATLLGDERVASFRKELSDGLATGHQMLAAALESVAKQIGSQRDNMKSLETGLMSSINNTDKMTVEALKSVGAKLDAQLGGVRSLEAGLAASISSTDTKVGEAFEKAQRLTEDLRTTTIEGLRKIEDRSATTNEQLNKRLTRLAAIVIVLGLLELGVLGFMILKRFGG